MKGAWQQAFDLSEIKARDYQSKSFKREDYFPFERLSYLQMIWIKVMRLRNLIENNKPTLHESLKDTLLDLINYAAFFVEHLDKEEK